MYRLVALGVLLTAALAAAANPKASTLARSAEQLYRDAKFTEAAEALREAYDLEPQAQFLFNRARAIEQAGQTAKAIELYRQYVRLPAEDTDPDVVARARSHIEQRTHQPEPGGPTKTAASPGLAATPTKNAGPTGKRPGEPESMAQAEVVAPMPSAGPNPKVLGLMVVGVSVATFAVGVTYGLLSASSRTAFTRALRIDDKRSAEASARTQALVADICFAAGAIAAVTGIMLLLRSDDAVTVAFAPVSQGGLLALGVRW